METLLKELHIEIFAYLKFNDLCQLTLTCKSFNEIISNSSTLMDKFCLPFNKHDLNVDFWMRKKYRRIKIRAANTNLMKFLKFNGKNICEIKMEPYEIKMEDLKRIFTLCPNVKQMNIYIYKIICSDINLTDPVMKLTLDSLTIHYCDSKIFEILEISVKHLYLNTNCLIYMSKIDLINFLRNQKQLKTLELTPNCSQLFEDDSLANVDFQLETLVVDLYNLTDLTVEHIKNFLKNQKSLIRIIDNRHSYYPWNFDYAYILRDFENVKELKASKPFDFLQSLPHIEKLTIEVCYVENRNIANLFPNVNNLIIDSMYRIKCVDNFTESTSKDYVQFKISENVKTLTVKNVKFINETLFDDNAEINIENLSIYDSDNVNWLIELFKNDRIKLKSLEIEGKKMKKSQREYLESLTQGEDKKIRKLKIYMPMKFDENHDYVCE